MKMSLIKQLLLYRYRFSLGYSLYIIFVIALLAIGIGQIPFGITDGEMSSVVRSTTFTPDALFTTPYVDGPYHVLQNLSIHLFGLSELSIKLPSLVFALCTAIALAVMLSRWFQPRIAIITGILAVTTPLFLGLGRIGTPLIMMAFWLAIILLSATRILHSAKRGTFWKLVLAVSVGFSLYTPLMVYPLIALSIAGLLHPHVRHTIRTMKLSRKLIAGALFLLAITPLVWTVYTHPSIVRELAGIPADIPSWTQIGSNIMYVLKSFVRVNAPVVSEIITPLFGVVTIIIGLLGLLKSSAQWYSARSYMIGLWFLLIIPIIIINPYYLPAIFIPWVLLLAIGIDSLIRSWYQLFPRNPYARIVGLIPLTVLIATVSFTNAGRYFYGYLYTPQVSSFHTELRSTQKALALPGVNNRPVLLVVTPSTEQFYSILKWQYPNLSVQSKLQPADTIVIHETAYESATTNYASQTPYRLFTNPYSNRGLDVRVYTLERS